jgi:hypothetical protein
MQLRKPYKAMTFLRYMARKVHTRVKRRLQIRSHKNGAKVIKNKEGKYSSGKK